MGMIPGKSVLESLFGIFADLVNMYDAGGVQRVMRAISVALTRNGKS